MTASFETSGMEADPLGLWQPAVSTVATAPGAVSFSVGGDEPSPEPADPVFRDLRLLCIPPLFIERQQITTHTDLHII